MCIIRTPDFQSNFMVKKVRIIFEVLRYVLFRHRISNSRETLPLDQYLRRLYNASPKIRGPPLKILHSIKFVFILHNFQL